MANDTNDLRFLLDIVGMVVFFVSLVFIFSYLLYKYFIYRREKQLDKLQPTQDDLEQAKKVLHNENTDKQAIYERMVQKYATINFDIEKKKSIVFASSFIDQCDKFLLMQDDFRNTKNYEFIVFLIDNRGFEDETLHEEPEEMCKRITDVCREDGTAAV